jgi:hypothetical protein
VIVDDSPPLIRAAKDKREKAGSLSSGGSEQEASGDVSSLRTESFDLEIGEFEPTHIVSLLLVSATVAPKCGLPSTKPRPIGEKRQIVRRPVAFHKAFEIAAIPGGDLMVEHAPDRMKVILRGTEILTRLVETMARDPRPWRI